MAGQNNRLLTQGTDSLRATANKIINTAGDFFTSYSGMYTEIDSNLKTNWVGADSDAFNAGVHEVEPKFKQMYELMQDFAQFLLQTADAYDQQEQDIRNAAQAIKFEG